MKRRRGMPAKAALRFALRGIAMQPVRFALTVLLGAFSFALAGLAVTAACYNESRAAALTYSQYGGAFCVYANEDENLFNEVETAFRLPCGRVGTTWLTAETLAGISAEEVWERTQPYAVRNVHASARVERVACFPEAVAAGCGISFLCGGMPEGEREVAIPSCLANVLLADGNSGAEEASLMGATLFLGSGNGEVTVSGVYENGGCILRGTEPVCMGKEAYTGAIFVRETLFEALSEGTAAAYFAGDGSPSTGRALYSFLASRGVSPLFSPLAAYREQAERTGGILGGVGGALALFSVVLLYQFVSISLEKRRREIGILRALGGRGTDVALLFLAENLLLGLCIGGLAAAMTAALLPAMNVALAALFGVKVALFAYVPALFPAILAVSASVALLSALPPLFREARAFPVDSLRRNEE